MALGVMWACTNYTVGRSGALKMVAISKALCALVGFVQVNGVSGLEA